MNIAIACFLAVVLLLTMLLSVEIGYRMGLRVRAKDGREHAVVVGSVETVVIGLVSLLLGFSFASAGTRFFERQDTMVREVNAIETAYLRADLLEEPFRSDYRNQLRAYVQSRLTLFESSSPEEFSEHLRQTEDIHPLLWTLAVEGVKRSPQFDETVLVPLNELIDLHTTRLSLVYRHNPLPVIAVLIIGSLVALLTKGFVCGLKRQRHWMLNGGLTLVMFFVLWLVIDLDYPRNGFIQNEQILMIDLNNKLNKLSL
ncbi:MAG: hypothetical protein KF865_15130 [Bdellovibrionaceae bacterium]|nr:hypothetical protein [Pseudobdellovibrionaceae bacterium]